MKKKKAAVFLTALALCTWAPQTVVGTSGTAGAPTHTEDTGTIKTKADWEIITITAAVIRLTCIQTVSARTAAASLAVALAAPAPAALELGQVFRHRSRLHQLSLSI